MRVFISADIEGCAGFASIEEGQQGHPEYDYFRRQMTSECAAACRGAIAADAQDILVRDAHGTARNIHPNQLPECARITRGSTGSIYAMVSGMELECFDAALMTGFHSGIGTNGSPVAHTFNRHTDALLLNGEPLSEFVFNAYSSASLGVPVPFVSGDRAICAEARRLIPAITTVETLCAIGAASTSIHPDLAVRRIEDGVAAALSGDYKACVADMPNRFVLDMRFVRPADAYFNSAYPGIEQLDAKTLRYAAGQWTELLRMVHFVLDK